jgi:hypothetical protein
MLSLVTSSIIYPELILRTSISLASNVVTSASYLISISHSDPDLHNFLTSNDIIEDINIIKTFIQEKQHKETSQTVSVCIENLSKTLEQLESNINCITKKIEEHKLLWFNYVRSYNISEEKIRIPILINQMKHRFDMLIKIS